MLTVRFLAELYFVYPPNHAQQLLRVRLCFRLTEGYGDDCAGVPALRVHPSFQPQLCPLTEAPWLSSFLVSEFVCCLEPSRGIRTHRTALCAMPTAGLEPRTPASVPGCPPCAHDQPACPPLFPFFSELVSDRTADCTVTTSHLSVADCSKVFPPWDTHKGVGKGALLLTVTRRDGLAPAPITTGVREVSCKLCKDLSGSDPCYLWARASCLACLHSKWARCNHTPSPEAEEQWSVCEWPCDHKKCS